MSSNLDPLKLLQCTELLQVSKHTAILSGAGISTASGIPDFRSAGSGLWQKHDPLQVASLSSFQNQPAVFFEWLHPLAVQIQKAQPNPAHLAVAELQSLGIISSVITQNIDSLHTLAGSTHVIEIHGNLHQWACTKCQSSRDQTKLLQTYCDTGKAPVCKQCGNYLKPGIVLFEETLSPQVWKEAVDTVKGSEVLLIIGTSLSVGPANELPLLALKNKSKLIIMTNSPTHLDASAMIVLHENVDIVLPALVKVLGV
jgi:NAD-dependent deacetylase